eukprot:Gregarina_sp_Pseudo_9__1521@NODE_2020_length_1199_cov_1271_142241_g1865_i0_p1_GENE_NODE_2020_length_1199_cov_1271_142241_g1865_i0NODE_2020_length_1199_cov_1271_142241_g1865_i0_p1_ORF_typecomplete_len314_score18_66Integrin_beta/PF00362_18/1e18Cys_rich_VLP/PF14194_6/0_021VWA_2/PF13519_6/0_079VWA/PF00092_28/0_12_NODE_2020_length_1199_cov_1271_142241_g1865_i01441085
MATVQLPTMVSILNETHPGSEFALVAFQDKPIVPFGVAPTPENGYYSDHCTFINSALTTNASAIEEIYAMYGPNGGGDPPESQFTALLAATQAQGIQWSGSPDRAQLIVMVTDAPPHFAGDGSDPQGMQPSTGTYNEANPDDQCVTEFYPSPEQVKTSIQQRSAYTAFLVYDPEYMEGLVGRSWLWFNRFLNQTDDFITLQAQDSSDFWTNLASIIGVIEDIECLPASTTTPPTTDTLPNTSPATVEPTGLPTLTPIGTVESTELPGSDSTEGDTTECPPCPTGDGVCCHWFRPAVVIKVNDRPERLVVDYEK